MNGRDVFASGLDQIRRSWAWFLTFGILLMLLGILCVAKAQTATKFSILALGWVLAISGVVWLLNAFRSIGWHGFFLYLLNGIIRGITGLLLLRHPDAGAVGVTMLIASLFMVGGIFRAAAASTIRFPWWGWTLLSGLISLFLGIFLFATWPSTSSYFIGMVIGIDLIFDGAALTGFAGAIHSLPKVRSTAAS